MPKFEGGTPMNEFKAGEPYDAGQAGDKTAIVVPWPEAQLSKFDRDAIQASFEAGDGDFTPLERLTPPFPADMNEFVEPGVISLLPEDFTIQESVLPQAVEWYQNGRLGTP